MDTASPVPTACPGRARLAQRARYVALNQLDFPGMNQLKIDANAQPRRAEPDAPYRRTDIDPIEIFRGNLSDPLKTAENQKN